jgi:hypothetical protein
LHGNLTLFSWYMCSLGTLWVPPPPIFQISVGNCSSRFPTYSR